MGEPIVTMDARFESGSHVIRRSYQVSAVLQRHTHRLGPTHGRDSCYAQWLFLLGAVGASMRL